MTGTKNSPTFIDAAAIRRRLSQGTTGNRRARELLDKARLLQGLSTAEVAELLLADAPEQDAALLETAAWVKQQIYGRRMVLFAPLYIGNTCSNDCLYCAFRAPNRDLARRTLSFEEIEAETRALLAEGHKRVLVLSGEDSGEHTDSGLNRLLEAIRRIYAVRIPGPEGGTPAAIRRINVEVAPLDEPGFRRLKSAGIGTYACFQETYDPELYWEFHRAGPKADYRNRLYVMDRAMAGGIDDVGIGALFGLGDWRFELLALLEHAAHLEDTFGCGPHTISVPRIEPAAGAPIAATVPQPVSDRDFRRLIAILRLALPYTGLILSTRENETLRDELFAYGISQISAGSRTEPGAYAAGQPQPGSTVSGQFQLGDHRSLEAVTTCLADKGYVPSFCTGCYRKGRVGADFMDLAKPGLIKCFCEPNAIFTYREYLADFASPAARQAGTRLINRLIRDTDEPLRSSIQAGLDKIAAGERDVYL